MNINLPFSVSFSFFRRRKRQQIRAYMRGYRKLRMNRELEKINHIKQQFEDIHFRKLEKSSPYVFGIAKSLRNRIVLQFILQHFCGLEFNKSILRMYDNRNKQHAIALPRAFRSVLLQNDLPTASLKSDFLWLVQIFRYWLLGVATGLRLIFQNFVHFMRRREEHHSGSAYFDLLTERNLPHNSPEFESMDVLTWYWESNYKPSEVTHMTHSTKPELNSNKDTGSVQYSYVKSGMPPLCPVRLLKFTIDWIILSARSFFGIWIGYWWSPILLGEALKSRYIYRQVPERMPRQYWFHNSRHLFRPLWTYAAERLGCDIYLYCYAANFNTFKNKSGYPVQSGSWNLVSWSKIIVWDQHQSDFFQRAGIDQDRISITGSIPFSDSRDNLPKCKSPALAIFDITPVRPSFYQSLAQSVEYYIPAIANQFLGDISDACAELDVNVFWKRKRTIGNLANSRYIKFGEALLSENDRLVLVPPDISAFRLIKEVDLVISMPFTSTALIAREMGIPSCYYDPSGIIEFDDRAGHGIEVINGNQSLKEWISKNLN